MCGLRPCSKLCVLEYAYTRVLVNIGHQLKSLWESRELPAGSLWVTTHHPLRSCPPGRPPTHPIRLRIHVSMCHLKGKVTWLWILVSGDTAQQFLFNVYQASDIAKLGASPACGALRPAVLFSPSSSFLPLFNITIWEESFMGSRWDQGSRSQYLLIPWGRSLCDTMGIWLLGCYVPVKFCAGRFIGPLVIIHL